MLIILFGAGGSGKTTLKENLLESDVRFSDIVSTTTREPRSGEVEGKDYYFVSVDEFHKRIFRIGFHDGKNFYGIENQEFSKTNGIIAIDLSLAHKVEEIFSDQALRIIYLNPNICVLKQRMLGRGDGLDKITLRMQRDTILNTTFNSKQFTSPFLTIEEGNKQEVLHKSLVFLKSGFQRNHFRFIPPQNTR